MQVFSDIHTDMFTSTSELSLDCDRFLNFAWFNFNLNIRFGADAAITST